MKKNKNKPQSKNSNQASPVIQNDAFLSKNKKRKLKREHQKQVVEQAKTGDFIPVKKNALKPLQVSGLTKKQQLSTSLPIKGSKKETQASANNSISTCAPQAKARNTKKITGILSNPNTPKRNKKEHVTFIDQEAEEGEEPISQKVVKPYEKKSQKKRPLPESSDEDDDDDGSVDAEDYLDMEASEGEETDDEDSDDADEDDIDDSDASNDENTLSSFMNDDEDDEEDDESDEEDDESDDDDDDDDSDDEPAPKAILSQKRKNEVLTPSKSKEKAVVLEPPTKKANVQTSPKLKEKSTESVAKVNILTPSKAKGKSTEAQTATAIDVAITSKPEGKSATEPETSAKKNAKEKKKDKKKKQNVSEEEKVSEEKTINTELKRPSDFIGFIRKLPRTTTENDVKSALTRVVDKDDVVAVMFAKVRRDQSINAFVYMKDAKTLGNVMHEKFNIAGSVYAVYRARSSANEESVPSPPESVAFLPRVPQWITVNELKEAVEKEIGAGKVTQIKEKRFVASLQTRNILMLFVDADALKQAIFKGDFKIKNHTVILREAMEGLQVPIYRAVFLSIPEGTDEETLKKAIESSIGKNTVTSIRFSFRKNSYAFVVFKDEEAMKKALALGETFSLKGHQVRVQPYSPRKPRKRAPPNEHAKAKRAEKRKQKPTSDDQGKKSNPQQPSAKKQKLENGLPSSPNQQKKKKKRNKTKKPIIASPSGEVKATKNPKLKQKKVEKPALDASPSKGGKIPALVSPSAEVKAKKNPKVKQKKTGKPNTFDASPAKDHKISPLKDKIQAKKDKLKGNKKARQQKNKNKNKPDA